MADKTFGVKVTEELYDKVKDMVDAAGITTKDWFEKAVALTEIQNLKEGASEYKQDLSELEVHTTRIYELVGNMIKRSNFLKDAALNEISLELADREEKLKDMQEQLLAAKASIDNFGLANERLAKENLDFQNHIEEIRIMNENNQLLIQELLEKIDVQSGLVLQYQSFLKENEVLKNQIEEKRVLYQSQLNELEIDLKSSDDLVNQLTRDLEEAEKNHLVELDRLAEKKDYEREKLLLETERKYQEKFFSANEEYNAQIKRLYEEREAERKEFEKKIELAEKPKTKKG